MNSIKDEYEKLQIIGQGSFATIWKVRHRKYGYIRTLKILNTPVADENDHAYQQFLKECTVLLNIGNGSNNNIVHIYQPRLIDNRAVVEMDYINGETLDQYLKRVRFMPIDEVMRFIGDIGGALAYCHHDIYKFMMNPNEDDLVNDPNNGQRYIIDDETKRRLVKKYAVTHNDLHSNNVMRRENDGSYVLLDFGLAIQNGKAVKSSALRGGALEYMSPEKFEDNSVITTQSDIYSFGILMYEALAGRVPFELGPGASFSDQTLLYQQHKTGIPPAIESLRREAFEAANPGQVYQKDYPEWLEQMIIRCLEKDPARRYTDAKEQMNDFKAMYQPQMAAVAPNVKVVEKIVEKRVEVPIEKVVEKIVEIPVSESGAHFLKIKSDEDCVFYVDGKKCADLKVDILNKIPFAKGEYELKFVTTDGMGVLEDSQFVMPDYDKQYFVQLKEKRELQIKQVEKLQKQDAGYYEVKGVVFKMIKVEGGTFLMGADNGKRGLFKRKDVSVSNFNEYAEEDEKPVHSVSLKDYYIGETVVTQELWLAVMGNNPSRFEDDNRPVEMVSWLDSGRFINELNKLTGQNFRLPTEAEWEFAARGGNKSLGFVFSGSNIIDDVAWHNANSSFSTHPVKQKNPNELGLYDMSGNVWEWCNDWYGEYLDEAQIDPLGPSQGLYRVLRGGSWAGKSRTCSVSMRGYTDSSALNHNFSLRLAKD